jgi:cysteine-rich repeat protein
MCSRARLTALLLLALGLAGCPGSGDSRTFERELFLWIPGRMGNLILAHEDGLTTDHQALPELGDAPAAIGGGLRRVDLTIETAERLAVVLEPLTTCVPAGYELDCRSFTRSELESAVPGQTLPRGGFLAGRVAERGRVTLQAPLPAGRLTFVRLDPPGEQPAATAKLTVRFEFNRPIVEPVLLTAGAVPGRCGDGLVEQVARFEQCDDENTTDGDGCSANCQRESSHCTADGRLWLSACDDGEPSRCESRACAADDPDPRCHEARTVTAATFVSGRFAPGDDVAARLRSTPAGLDCACGVDAVGAGAGRECGAACTATLPACTTEITSEAGVDAPLASWGGSCWGSGVCRAPGLADGRVTATFATTTEGLAFARALVESAPGATAPRPGAVAAGADGGLFVAIAYSAPFVFAGQSLGGDGPSAMFAHLGTDGALLWLRRLSVRPGELLSVLAAAAAPDGGALLVGSFRGRLDASGFDLQTTHPEAPMLFVVAYAADGTPRWATAVALATPSWPSAAVVATDGATVALAADVYPAVDLYREVALVALDADGAISRSRLVLGAPDRGEILARGVGVLPGGDWLLAGVHSATTEAGGLLPPRTGDTWQHFVARVAADGTPVWTTPLGETVDEQRPSVLGVDRVTPGGWYLLPVEPQGSRLVRIDASGAAGAATPVTPEDWAPRLGVDPATGDAFVAGNGATSLHALDAWEIWLARVTAGGAVVYTQRHSGRPAAGLRVEALAVAPAGRARLLATYRISLTIAGTTLRGCDDYYHGCTSLALVGAAP